MKNLWMVLFVMAACSKGKSGAAGDCKEVGASVAKYWTDKAAAAKSDQEREMATKMAPTAAARIEQHCTADKWSADAIACMKGNTDVSKCSDKLTAEQLDKLKASAPPLTVEHPASDLPPTTGSGAPQGSGSN